MFAAFRHKDLREGFEVVFISGRSFTGHTSAVEDGEPFAVRYTIELDDRWHTRTAQVCGESRTGTRSVRLESDGDGHWLVDGRPAPELDGILDVDLESSALTNAFPVRRLALSPGDAADAPAAWVRALDLSVERLEQRYVCTGENRYDYWSPDLSCELVYDEDGLVREYPGIAVRVR